MPEKKEVLFTTLFLKGSESIHLKLMVKIAVEKFTSGFKGHQSIALKPDHAVSVTSSSVLGGKLRKIVVHDGKFGYDVTALEPNPDKGAVNLQIYVKKAIFDKVVEEYYWQRVWHITYSVRTKEYTFIIDVPDDNPYGTSK